MKKRIKIRNSSKVCDHDRIINTRKKIIRPHNPPSLFQREELKKISKKIYEHSEEIASDIVEIIEDTYIFASGDLFSFIRKKIINTPINIISENINSKIEETGIYDKIKNEYDLKETEIITIRLIIKKIISEIIEYFAETIIKYIETKENIEWAKKELYNTLSKNIEKYFSKIRKPLLDDSKIRIPTYFKFNKSEITIPTKINQEIKNKQKTFRDNNNFEISSTHNIIEKTIEQFIEKYYQKSLSKNIICEDTAKAYLFRDLINLKLKNYTVLTEFKSNSKYCRYDIAIINKDNLKKYNEGKIELNQIIPEVVIELKYYLNLTNKINLKRIEEELLNLKNKSNAKMKYFIYLDESLNTKEKETLYEIKHKIKEEINLKIYIPK